MASNFTNGMTTSSILITTGNFTINSGSAFIPSVSTNTISTSILTGDITIGNRLTVPNFSTNTISSNSIVNNTYTGNGSTQLFSDLRIYQTGTSNYTRYVTLAGNSFIDLQNIPNNLIITNGGLSTNGAFTALNGATMNSTLTINNTSGGGITINTGNIVMNGTGSITMNTGGAIYGFNTSNVQTMLINTAGNGEITTSGPITCLSLTQTSDMRLKTDITPLQNSLSTLLQIQGVSFCFNCVEKPTKQIGFIAQEVEKILPDVVTTDNSSDGIKGVSYGNIVAVTVEAIKELSAQVNEIATQVKDLTAKVSTLMNP